MYIKQQVLPVDRAFYMHGPGSGCTCMPIKLTRGADNRPKLQWSETGLEVALLAFHTEDAAAAAQACWSP